MGVAFSTQHPTHCRRSVRSSAHSRMAFCFAPLAVTLLTKQNFSYALLPLYPAALLAHLPRRKQSRHVRNFFLPFGICIAVGVAAFLPLLIGVSSSFSFRDKLFYKGLFLEDVAQRRPAQLVS